MNINKFAVLLADKEKGKKEVNIAQIKELLRHTKDILVCKVGIDLYQIIKKI